MGPKSHWHELFYYKKLTFIRSYIANIFAQIILSGAQQVGKMPDSNENLHGWKTLIRTGIENIIKVCNR